MTTATVPDVTVPEVLSAAAALIDTHGWNKLDLWPDCCKDVPWEPGMPCCALAAIIVASGHTTVTVESRRLPAVRYMAHWVAELHYPDTRSDNVYASTVSNWNDAKGRSATQVTRGLRAAADSARSQIKRAEEAAAKVAAECIEEVPADADDESNASHSA